MEEPVVTIGLPFCGNEEYLRVAVRSVFAQTFSRWRLLLVDDGSQDRSVEFAQMIRDSRVEAHVDGAAKGLPARLNQITQMATTRYLCRMDADDAMHPERLERQVAYCEAHPNVEVMGSGVFSMDTDGHIRGYRGNVELPVAPATILRRGLFAHPTVFGRTDWFRKYPYDESIRRAEDYELWVRTAGYTEWGFMDPAVLYYREPASVRLAAYVASAKGVRAVLRLHGPKIVGCAETVRLIAMAKLKEYVYRAGLRLGVAGSLVARRSRALSDAQLREAERGLRAVFSTRIPGVD